MSYIKEPEGIDFIINGKQLTDEQKQAISTFIKADKERLLICNTRPSKVRENYSE